MVVQDCVSNQNTIATPGLSLSAKNKKQDSIGKYKEGIKGYTQTDFFKTGMSNFSGRDNMSAGTRPLNSQNYKNL